MKEIDIKTLSQKFISEELCRRNECPKNPKTFIALKPQKNSSGNHHGNFCIKLLQTFSQKNFPLLLLRKYLNCLFTKHKF